MAALRFFTLVFLAIGLTACARGIKLSQPAETVSICTEYQLADPKAQQMIESRMREIIRNSPRLYACNSSQSTQARLNMNFSDYKLVSPTGRAAQTLATAGSVALVAEGVPFLVVLIPSNALTAQNTIHYSNTGATEQFNLKVTDASWFESREQQIKKLPQMVDEMVDSILKASKGKASSQQAKTPMS